MIGLSFQYVRSCGDLNELPSTYSWAFEYMVPIADSSETIKRIGLPKVCHQGGKALWFQITRAIFYGYSLLFGV